MRHSSDGANGSNEPPAAFDMSKLRQHSTDFAATMNSDVPINVGLAQHNARAIPISLGGDNGHTDHSGHRRHSAPKVGFHVAPQLQIPSFASPAAFDEKFCALKTVIKPSFVQRVTDCQERADALVREVLCQSLVCKVGKAQGLDKQGLSVVDIYGVFESLEGFSMELELMQAVDLCDKLQKVHRFKEEEVKSIIGQMLRALLLCELAGVGHRDVKLSNITIARPPSMFDGLAGSPVQETHIKVKLADFGMAGFVGSDGCLRGRCGTMGYVAPEILCAGVHEGYANRVDMFSVSE